MNACPGEIALSHPDWHIYTVLCGCINTKAESDLNYYYPINRSVKSKIFRLISYSVYSPTVPEIRLIQHPICTNK